MYVKPSSVWIGLIWGHGQTAAETAGRDPCDQGPCWGVELGGLPVGKTPVPAWVSSGLYLPVTVLWPVSGSDLPFSPLQKRTV